MLRSTSQSDFATLSDPKSQLADSWCSDPERGSTCHLVLVADGRDRNPQLPLHGTWIRQPDKKGNATCASIRFGSPVSVRSPTLQGSWSATIRSQITARPSQITTLASAITVASTCLHAKHIRELPLPSGISAIRSAFPTILSRITAIFGRVLLPISGQSSAPMSKSPSLNT